MPGLLTRLGRRALMHNRARVDRFKLASRAHVRERLLGDGEIVEAVREHAETHAISEDDAWRKVERYIQEIVPFFNVVAYYQIGYRISGWLLNLFYKVSIDFAEPKARQRLPRDAVIVYVMNHRSNADYVLVSYALAGQVAISYAVGEWARAFPLEHVFKAFGSYFIRRRYREPLYHAVLERYVQLITRSGVTQGIFPEGGLTRDGRLRPPKLGLLDYICRTMNDQAFTRDIWLVPVAINYDRVLEDRSLIRELVDAGRRPNRVSQLVSVSSYVARNVGRALTGRLKRYGRAAVNFGAPRSVRDWLATAPAGVLDWPKERRLPELERLAREMMDRIGAIVPVTPVPLAAAAILSLGQTAFSRPVLLERMDQLRDRLRDVNAKVVRGGAGIRDIWDRAWRMLKLRHLVVDDGDSLVVLPRGRPLLEYYANSIAHLLPIRGPRVPFHKAHELDTELPRLRPPEPR